MRSRGLEWMAALVLWLALGAPFAAVAADGDPIAVPPLRAHVTDLTGTVEDVDRQALEQKLSAWEAQRGAQFAVLMVPATRPETIDEYSQRVTDAWKIGRKGIDDGVLLLIAKDEKKLRFQVGRGFEGSLTDVTAKRIIEEVIVPAFRKGDFVGGINGGVDKVFAVVAGETLPPPAARQSSSQSASAHRWVDSNWSLVVILGGMGLFFFLASTLSRMFGNIGGSMIGGGIAGAAAWFLTALPVAGIVAAVLMFIAILITVAGRSGGRGYGPGGFSHGGGAFSSSGSGGGSSWSGGGGDFGGGGASGSWGGGDSGGSDSGGGDSGGGGDSS